LETANKKYTKNNLVYKSYKAQLMECMQSMIFFTNHPYVNNAGPRTFSTLFKKGSLFGLDDCLF